MSKKSKKRNRTKCKDMRRKRRVRQYNQKQFTEIICETCGACRAAGVTHVDPIFCYSELYRHDPKPFVEGPMVNLERIVHGMRSTGRTMRSCEMEQFQKIFCATGICTNGDQAEGMECDSINECFILFREQLGLFEGGGTIRDAQTGTVLNGGYKSVASKGRKTGKRKNRYVAEAYATSFVREDPKFKELVEKILHGNNHSEQDNGKEPTGANKGSSDSGAEGGGSEVSGSSGKRP